MSAGFSAPNQIRVIASLLLVALTAGVAYQQRLGLTRELVVVAVRADVQLVAAGAVLGLIFAYGGLPGGFGWVVVMIVIAGQVAGHRRCRRGHHHQFGHAAAAGDRPASAGRRPPAVSRTSAGTDGTR